MKQRQISEHDLIEFRVMRELTFLIAAANTEADLPKRLERLQRAGDVLESLSRIIPGIDAGFWFSSLEREIEACQEKIAELYGDDEQLKL